MNNKRHFLNTRTTRSFPLHKKRDTKLCSNYRITALILYISKVTLWIFKNRFKRDVDKFYLSRQVYTRKRHKRVNNECARCSTCLVLYFVYSAKAF